MEAVDTAVEHLRALIAQTEAQLKHLKAQLARAERQRQTTQSPILKDAAHRTDANPSLPTTFAIQSNDLPKWPLQAEEYKRYGRQMILPQIGLQGWPSSNTIHLG